MSERKFPAVLTGSPSNELSGMRGSFAWEHRQAVKAILEGPEIKRVADAWPDLPESIRDGILAIAGATVLLGRAKRAVEYTHRRFLMAIRESEGARQPNVARRRVDYAQGVYLRSLDNHQKAKAAWMFAQNCPISSRCFIRQARYSGICSSRSILRSICSPSNDSTCRENTGPRRCKLCSRTEK